MIDKPQIFIMYGSGMFGTFIAGLFSHHPNANVILSDEIKGDEYKLNAHHSYKKQIDLFHNENDYEKISNMNNNELSKFFDQFNKKNIGIHRMATYDFATLPYEKYFKNYVKILIICKEKERLRYAQRHVEVGGIHPRVNLEFWYKQIKKPIKELPEYFIKGMNIKQRYKFIEEQTNRYFKRDIFDPKHDIIFDPDNIQYVNKLQKLVNDSCKILNIKTFNLPKQKIEKFIEKNKIYFDKTLK